MYNEECLRLLKDVYPHTKIVEAKGNPNFMGDYLFYVDGRPVYVTPDRAIVEEDNEPYEPYSTFEDKML